MPSEGHSGSAAGGQLEEKVDLSAECDAKLPQAQALVESGQLREALALLAALEKRCRVGNDNTSLVRVCEASLQHCKDAGDEEALVATLQTLATRRSQKSSAVRALVHKALPWCLEEGYMPIAVEPSQKEARDKLVVALRDITDGKIFLEAERARLTRALATIKVCVCWNGCDACIGWEKHLLTL
jgi:26S proteasome regulatory subunit N5